MARPTRRRRSTKHRGNAAGMIEARGRTGRKLTATERQAASSASTKTKSARATSTSRKNRYDVAPTWKGAALRAVAAALIVYAIATVVLKRSITANLVLVPIVLLLYLPMIYYTDTYLYRRHQRRKNA
jgi:hypothetical protein